jgi:hypothetical protein
VCMDVVFSCVFCCKCRREFFLLYSEQYDSFNCCSRGNLWRVKSAEEAFYLSLNGAKCGILFYSQYLDKRCFYAHNIYPSI